MVKFWQTHHSVLRLTPSFRLVVLLHHQWDHVQLLLVRVVGLCVKDKSVYLTRHKKL